ncbi:MAG: hypothetical protein LBK29_00060 [Oscillospiraceae bacterium]|nr:hypothetical protein [Oscillospiraceae bacterium]
MQIITNETVAKNKAIYLRSKGFAYSAISEQLRVPINTIKSFCYRDMVKEGKHCKRCGKVIYDGSKAKPKTFCCNKCRISYWNAQRSKIMMDDKFMDNKLVDDKLGGNYDERTI